jgi:FkbM family methyltransferase
MELFIADKAGETLLVDYPLHKDSVVFELGGYTGMWSEKIANKYACNLYIFEPVDFFYNKLVEKFKENNKVRVFNYGVLDRSDTCDIAVCNDGSSFFTSSDSVQKAEIKNIEDVLVSLNVHHVDLVQINIEGSEYDLLDHMIAADIMRMFTYVQIQFHRNVPNADERRDKIVQRLKETHDRMFNYEFVFESWKLRY